MQQVHWYCNELWTLYRLHLVLVHDLRWCIATVHLNKPAQEGTCNSVIAVSQTSCDSFLSVICKSWHTSLPSPVSFSTTAAAARHVPPLSVSPALPTAQTSAYYPPCALHPPHASCSGPGHLSRPRQDRQVHQPRGNDITGLLLRLLCSLWHPRGRQGEKRTPHAPRCTWTGRGVSQPC